MGVDVSGVVSVDRAGSGEVTETPRADVTVVVLSFNRPLLLEKALQSIDLQTYPHRDVIVVDNRSASSDRVFGVVRRFPHVRLIANEVNRGFTGGMNDGLAQAQGEYVYLTEDDIELAPDCLSHLVEYLSAHPETGIAGPVMWNRHSPTIRCAGGEFSLGSVYRMRVTGANDLAPPSSSPFQTMYVPGAMIAARTSVLREIGGFNNDFFMYGEDVELCSRVRRHGLEITIVPAAKVYHHEPPTAPDSPLLVFHKNKNLAALYLLHAPLVVLPEFLLRYAALEGFRRVLGRRASFGAWFKSWMWTARHAPGLLLDRARR